MQYAKILFRPGIAMPVADFARKWLCLPAKLSKIFPGKEEMQFADF